MCVCVCVCEICLKLKNSELFPLILFLGCVCSSDQTAIASINIKTGWSSKLISRVFFLGQEFNTAAKLIRHYAACI